MILVLVVLILGSSSGFAATERSTDQFTIRFQPRGLDLPCELRFTSVADSPAWSDVLDHVIHFRPGASKMIPSEWVNDEAELAAADARGHGQGGSFFLENTEMRHMWRNFFGDLLRGMIGTSDPADNARTGQLARQYFTNQTADEQDVIQAVEQLLRTGEGGHVLAAIWPLHLAGGQKSLITARIFLPVRTAPRGLMVLPFPTYIGDEYAVELPGLPASLDDFDFYKATVLPVTLDRSEPTVPEVEP